MKIIILFIIVLSSMLCYSQPTEKLLISAIVLNSDSVPVTNVAIVSIQTGKTVRTNSKGFFETEIAEDDSLLIYHIAFKRQFITLKNSGRSIILEPEVHEIMQVNVSGNKDLEQKKMDQILSDIRRLAPMQKIPSYDMKSIAQRFVDQQGSHNKGFSPFFGPTVGAPLSKLASPISKRIERRERKKMTSHYHLVKKGN